MPLRRKLEPEIMSDRAHALAYARADFSSVNHAFVSKALRLIADHPEPTIIDLGCGPGDILVRLAKARPRARLLGIDGSAIMVSLAKSTIAKARLTERVEVREERLTALGAIGDFDLIVSNSLVHHLPKPEILWKTLTNKGGSLAQVYIMDLLRPPTLAAAQKLVNAYAEHENPLLREDFFNSLRAAFTIEEVQTQLHKAGLHHLILEQATDRHWVAQGIINFQT